MNRNNLIALVIVLGIAVMLLSYRLRTESVTPIPEGGPQPEPEPEPEEVEILEPELETLPSEYQPDGALPGLVRVFDGSKSIQLSGDEEYTCEAAGGGEPPLFVETFATLGSASSYRKLSSEYEGKLMRVRREVDNAEADIDMSDDPAVIMKSIRDFGDGKDETWTTDFNDFGDLKHVYGLSRMDITYTGPLIEVTNADGVAADIGQQIDGYGNYNIDVAQILSHCPTGNGHITKFYDQKGASDFPVTDGRVRICTDGVIETDNDANIVGNVYVAVSETIAIPTISNSAFAFWNVTLGRTSGGNLLRLQDSTGTNLVENKMYGGAPFFSATIQTSTFPSTQYDPTNWGSVENRFNTTAWLKVSTTDLSIGTTGGWNFAFTDSYGSFSFDELTLQVSSTTNQLPDRPGIKSFGVYGSMTDYAGFEKRMLQLYSSTWYNVCTVANYDQSGQSNTIEYPVAISQPIIKVSAGYYVRSLLDDLRLSKKIFTGQYQGPSVNASFINIDVPSNELTIAFVSNLGPAVGITRSYASVVFDSDYNIFNVTASGEILWDGNYLPFQAGRSLFMFVLTQTRAKFYQDGLLVSDLPRNFGTISSIVQWFVQDPRNDIMYIGDLLFWPSDKSSQAQEIFQDIDEYWEIS